MTKTQRALLEKLHRAQAFFDEYAESLPAFARGKARTELEEIVAALETEAATRERAIAESRTHMAEVRERREDLRIGHLKAIVAVARAKAQRVPLVQALHVPSQNASDFELIAVATSTAEAIREHRHLFLEQCFDEDFVEQLIAATEALESAKDAALSSQLTSTGATKMIAVLVKRGQELIHLLDALVLSQVRELGLVKTWRMCTAVRRTPGPRRTTRRAAEERAAVPLSVA